VRAEAAVTSVLGGPEQLFRVTLTKPVANFGVVMTSRAKGVRVEPRVVAAGDENRLTGYAALPLNHNPYVEEFGEPVPVAGALRPAPGTYYVVFDSPTAAGAGAFRFRFWIEEVAPPKAMIVRRQVRRGDPIRLRVQDSGSGVDVRSLEATLDGRPIASRLIGSEIRIPTRSVAIGTHRLRVELSDHQETRNNENVLRILPNTRAVSVVVTVRPR
jgi:hypothetical protein